MERSLRTAAAAHNESVLRRGMAAGAVLYVCGCAFLGQVPVQALGRLDRVTGQFDLCPARHAVMLIPGVIGSADLEAGRDHGAVFPVCPGVAIELDARQLVLGGDALGHGGGVLQRQPCCQSAMFGGPVSGGR
jgi:hypothetical protein